MRVPVVVIGGGHAGLVMSRRLAERAIDHVVLEAGTVANSWRTQRWDSLRLLTPAWHNRLPGDAPPTKPDSFPTAGATATTIERYATTIGAPVHEHTRVTALRARGGRAGAYEVVTNRGTWTCAAVVIATGANARASVPACAGGLPVGVASLSALEYRNPDQLADGGVLVVGAGSTGVQLADEIRSSGRPVTLSVGEHVRMLRSYRGRDAFWWSEAAAILGERHDAVDDIVRVRHLPSPQLIGTPEGRELGLGTLQAAGVTIVGRLGRLADGVAQFSGGLANTCTLADLKLARLLARFDEAAELLPDAHRNALEPPHRPDPTPVPTAAPTALDLAAAGITTVVWATGLRPDHGWVELPVFDHAGRIRHTGGVVDGAPGVYVLGLPALRTRRSSYIAGAAGDTAELADHLATLCNGLATTTLGAPAQPAHRLSSRVAGSSSPEPVGHRSRAGSLRGA